MLRKLVSRITPAFVRNSARSVLGYVGRCQFIFDNPFSVFVSLLTNPFFFVRRNLFKNITHFAKDMDGRLLDFGCGNKPYERYFCNVSEYVGCDIEASGHAHANEKIDVFYDGKTLPFEDCSFDNVLSSEVFEHIFNLEPMIKELHRVLKPGGGILVTVPFVWNEHEAPYDFGRYTSFGITDLLERNGFKVEEFRKSTSYVELLFQMWVEYLRYGFSKVPFAPARLLLHLIFIFPSILIGTILSAILPRNHSLYGDNIVFARKASGVQQ